MLLDRCRYTPLPVAEKINLSPRDTDVLRRLAGELAEIAALPVHKEKARLWQKLNDRESVRPMVWITEICWHEMNVDDELTLRTEHPWAQEQERDMRRTLYQWRHLPGDMIVSDYLTCPLAIHSTDFGIYEDVDIATTDPDSDVVSRHYHIQIRDFPDLEKIKMPVVTHNELATEICYQTMCKVYSAIMPVRKIGQTHVFYTPWDYLIRWWGVEAMMLDLVERPDLVHAGVERMVDAWMTELDQMIEMNLLSLGSHNTRIGSGGYGYTRSLPGQDFDPEFVKPLNMWGFSNAQIFSDVSPEMHWEFAVKHDLRWLERWGMVYYGCCEPLDRKIEILRRIPNLRKISASSWCDTDRLVATVGSDYVVSHKPTPAIFARDEWDPAGARLELRNFLRKTEGQCHVEVIMKDISTVRHEPRKLWEWEKIAMEVVTEKA